MLRVCVVRCVVLLCVLCPGNPFGGRIGARGPVRLQLAGDVREHGGTYAFTAAVGLLLSGCWSEGCLFGCWSKGECFMVVSCEGGPLTVSR